MSKEKEYKIQSALISVHNKAGIDAIVKELDKLQVKIYSTGGTAEHIKKLKIKVNEVSKLTGFPEILGGRVKTLHPQIFGGILARRGEDADLKEIKKHKIPTIDLVIVDLYPFGSVLESGAEASEIIENIDIGGISLIRAAAKNFQDVTVVPSSEYFEEFLGILKKSKGKIPLEQRKNFAARAFSVSSSLDKSISGYLGEGAEGGSTQLVLENKKVLRYGENPHQTAAYWGNLEDYVQQVCGKELSYNNILDVDSAIGIMEEFKDEPCFAIIKHNNPCGVAFGATALNAFRRALECDPQSAFGGVLIYNKEIDVETANELNKLFYEILIAEAFIPQAMDILKKKGRIILKRKARRPPRMVYRSAAGGILEQERDDKTATLDQFEIKTSREPSPAQMEDLIFADKVVKHLKSNAIAIVKDNQLIGSGGGQTSRVEAVKQAIQKAKERNFDLEGAVLASDAFFPFSDSVELAAKNKINVIVEPGGSVRDEEVIKFCEANQMSLVFSNMRHFRH